jgi:hypothetical protein
MNYQTKHVEQTAETVALESGVSKILSDTQIKLNMEESVQVYKHANHLLPKGLVVYVESWLTDRVEETYQRARGMTSMIADRRKVSRKNPKNL